MVKKRTVLLDCKLRDEKTHFKDRENTNGKPTTASPLPCHFFATSFLDLINKFLSLNKDKSSGGGGGHGLIKIKRFLP